MNLPAIEIGLYEHLLCGLRAESCAWDERLPLFPLDRACLTRNALLYPTNGIVPEPRTARVPRAIQDRVCFTRSELLYPPPGDGSVTPHPLPPLPAIHRGEGVAE